VEFVDAFILFFFVKNYHVLTIITGNSEKASRISPQKMSVPAPSGGLARRLFEGIS
jgi:hypothetical protein